MMRRTTSQHPVGCRPSWRHHLKGISTIICCLQQFCTIATSETWITKMPGVTPACCHTPPPDGLEEAAPVAKQVAFLEIQWHLANQHQSSIADLTKLEGLKLIGNLLQRKTDSEPCILHCELVVVNCHQMGCGCNLTWVYQTPFILDMKMLTKVYILPTHQLGCANVETG